MSSFPLFKGSRFGSRFPSETHDEGIAAMALLSPPGIIIVEAERTRYKRPSVRRDRLLEHLEQLA